MCGATTNDSLQNETYYCYLLRCADGTLYTGVTTDFVRRVEEQ